MEFLVRLSVDVDSVPRDERDTLLARERETAFSLKREGVIQRMWRVTGQSATLSVWAAASAEDLDRQLSRLPLRRWMDAHVTELAPHYLEQG